MRKATKKGFTLVELVIVIVIVGILSIVAVPLYRGYLRRAISTEATSLLSAINTAQRVYSTEYGEYLEVPETSVNTILDVDARSNKYFTSFTIRKSGNSYSAVTEGVGGATGISATILGAEI